MIKRRLYTHSTALSAPHVCLFACFETQGAAWPGPPGTPPEPAARGDRPRAAPHLLQHLPLLLQPRRLQLLLFLQHGRRDHRRFCLFPHLGCQRFCKERTVTGGHWRSLTVTRGRRCRSDGRALPRSRSRARPSPPASREQKPRAAPAAREAALFSRDRPLRLPLGPCPAILAPGRLRARRRSGLGALFLLERAAGEAGGVTLPAGVYGCGTWCHGVTGRVVFGHRWARWSQRICPAWWILWFGPAPLRRCTGTWRPGHGTGLRTSLDTAGSATRGQRSAGNPGGKPSFPKQALR